MNTKQLRQKILDLAIRGKLVPQDPSDEPASVLLERIRAEKEKLMKEGKIKRSKKDLASNGSDKLHYENMPEGWTIASLSDICSIITDGTHQTPTYSDDGYIFLSSKNVTTGKIDWKNIMHIPESLHNELYARLAPQVGDILLAKNGTTGYAAVVDRDCVFDIYVSLALIRTFKNEILPEYLRHIISANSIQEHFKGHLKGIGVPNLHLEHIRTAIIPVCPLAEQKRIVEAINKAFEIIDEIESCRGSLSSVITTAKQKILSLAIQGKLVPQDPSDEPASILLEHIRAEKEKLIKAGKIKRSKSDSAVIVSDDNSPYENLPDGWECARLGELFNIVSARRVHEADWKTSGIPFYRTREIVLLSEKGKVNNDLFISEELYYKFSLGGKPEENDIMITAVGTIGKTYVVKENDIFYYKDASVLCLENFSMINAWFINYLFQSTYMKNQVYGNSKGTTVDTITIVKANKYIVPIPPLAEQHRIVAAIEEAFEQLDSIAATLA